MTRPHERMLVGCGIFQKEIARIIQDQHWSVDTVLLDSALHMDFNKLSRGLEAALHKHQDRHPVVFYGCCHPLMDRILKEHGTTRTVGQNCAEMLLGPEVFNRELEGGAYFLFEDWARHWDHVTRETFGDRPDIMREIFHLDRRYVLAITTPCSGDFSADAEKVSEQVGLPLRWMHVSLDHLTSVLRDAWNAAPPAAQPQDQRVPDPSQAPPETPDHGKGDHHPDV